MNARLEVSVVIPTYNRAGLIGDTLHSIINQDHRPAEVVVVDDGSTDNTEEVVQSYGSLVNYIRIENSGECRARNVGVANTSAPWICFCDSDDLWRRDKLRLQAGIFETNPELEYSFTNFRTVVDDQWSALTKFDSSPVGYWELPGRQDGSEVLMVKGPLFASLLRHQPIFPSTLMMKRSFFEATGPWNEALGRTPSVDLEYHLRCVMAREIGVVKAPVVGIRKHDANFSGDSLRTTIGEVEILRYVLSNNPHARRFENQILEQIQARSASAAEGAFRAGKNELVSELLKSVPHAQRPWKLHVKSLISRLPPSVGRNVRKGAMALRVVGERAISGRG